MYPPVLFDRITCRRPNGINHLWTDRGVRIKVGWVKPVVFCPGDLVRQVVFLPGRR